MKILITGATNGMGKGVAKVLASIDKQHEIIILCRSKARGIKVIEEFKNTTLNENISLIQCDLSKLSDVKNAIKEIQCKHTYLDGIFINAGLGYAAQRIETEDGMDSHFQVNYLSQFMLTLNLLSLLEASETGGRIIFNVTEGGEIFWDDMQMKNKWGYEDGIHQAMVAKRMFQLKLHHLYANNPQMSFVGFQIPKAVWTNQINIIPKFMRIMATLMKLLGRFYTMKECGKIMAPLFIENQEESLERSGKFITFKKGEFTVIQENNESINETLQQKLWDISLELCSDEKTRQISKELFT